ncbi:hypothetical protein EVAR_73146_1 [Eumeta japonica]|uniref:Uncharacterized protein n=1 Tax=Eumeta variegata TaxID=151549 RepID=A0A4C1SLA3_EUMVA|nr:hypothetical protein EVAR_73146_1 [Eumeta japonica]
MKASEQINDCASTPAAGVTEAIRVDDSRSAAIGCVNAWNTWAGPSRKEPSGPDRVTRAFHCNIIARNHSNVPKEVSRQNQKKW